MAKDSKWQDEYWLLLMQIYLQKPVGLKPMADGGLEPGTAHRSRTAV